MKLARNVGAGLGSSIWTAVLGLAVVPQYLKYLGIEAYGLIGFLASIQALFQILDLGMAATVNRELARAQTQGQNEAMRNLLHTLSVIYWSVATFIGCVMLILAPTISSNWLSSKTLDRDTVTHAVMLMGVVIACRWPIGLYLGALNGLQRIALTSGIAVVMGTLGTIGAVCVLAFLSPKVDAFFLWQGAVGLIYALVLRWAAWHVVGRTANQRFDAAALRSIWRFSASMMALTLSALIFTQLDKLLLSKLLSLENFGQYVLAGIVASALSLLITPFYNAVYPRFCAYVAGGKEVKLIELYHLSGRILATLLFPIAMIIVLSGVDLVRLWTGNVALAEKVGPLAAFLAAGTALHGTMYIPHALVLAKGKTFIPLTINVTLLVVMVPVTILFALSFGAMGGAAAWLVLHSLYVLLGTFLMQRYVGDSTGIPWLQHEVGVPLVVCVSIGYTADVAIRYLQLQTAAKITLSFSAALISVFIIFAVSPSMRHGLRGVLQAEFGS